MYNLGRCYYRCKECASEGYTTGYRVWCPVCGSKYVSLYCCEHMCVQEKLKLGGKI